MKSLELNRQVQRIHSLIELSQDACGDSIEMLSHWAKYLCVLAGGFLENAIQVSYSNFAKEAASEPVQNYALWHLSRIRNPKTKRFIEVAGAFKAAWAEELEEFVNEGGRREAIDSIMLNRHLIAHGQDSNITIPRVRDYLSKSIRVIEFIEEQHDS